MNRVSGRPPRNTRRGTRWSRAVKRVACLPALALLLLVAATGGALADDSPRQCSSERISRSGRWEHIQVPTFSNGPQAMTEFAVAPDDPDLLLVTNGTTVERSTDGGCSWRTTFDLARPPGHADYSSSDSAIVDLAVAPHHALLVISQREARPHVVMSAFGGETWRRGDDGLQGVAGRALQGGFTATDPRYAYLLVDEGARAGQGAASIRQTLFESTTAGGDWGVRGGSDPSPSVTLPQGERIATAHAYAGFVADPREGGRIFLYGPGGLDSYQQGAKAQLLKDDVSELAAFPNESSTTLLAAVRGTKTFRYSHDAGTTFRSFEAPGEVTSFAEALRPRSYYFSAGGRVFFWGGGRIDDVSEGARLPVSGLLAARSQERLTPFTGADILTLYGRTESSIVRTSERRIVDIAPVSGSIMIDTLAPPSPDRQLPGSLLPKATDVVLREDQEKTVPFDLYLPETPTPLDVFFDVDTTNSMGSTIDGLRAAMEDIIRELSAEGIDVWFGAAQYKSFGTPPAYELLQDVAPAGPGLVEALNRLGPAGGGFETQLESLMQIVTGKGSTIGAGIEPGQAAEWRKGSLRVVVNMTDEPISTGEPHPSYEKVARTMLGEEVLHFGIAVQNEVTKVQLGSPLPGLLRISRETRSVAPSAGADCDGDGRPDIYGGEPLVCVVDPNRAQDAAVMGEAIINVLKSVSDVGEVKIVATSKDESSRADVATAVPTTPVIEGVDFKVPNRRSFGVTFACPDVTRTRTFPLTINAVREAGVLASASAHVTCEPVRTPRRDPPRPPAEAPPPPVVPPATIAVVLLPPPPIPNLPQHPNPNPNPHPNPQPQGQGQGAAATQEQEEPQLALVEQSADESRPAEARRSRGDRGGEYAMSRYVPPERPNDVLFVAAAGAMAAAFGCAALRRSESAVCAAGVAGRRRRPGR